MTLVVSGTIAAPARVRVAATNRAVKENIVVELRRGRCRTLEKLQDNTWGFYTFWTPYRMAMCPRFSHMEIYRGNALRTTAVFRAMFANSKAVASTDCTCEQFQDIKMEDICELGRTKYEGLTLPSQCDSDQT